MKFKVLLLTVFFAAGAVSSVAVAKGPPPGKGKNKGAASSSTSSTTTTTPAPRCKPSVAVILKGSFVSAGANEFTMDVKQGNKRGQKYVGDEVTLKVDAKTKFRRNGRAELEDFEAGDWLNVQARDCKKKPKDEESESAGSGPGLSEQPQQLLARRVVGKPKKDDSDSTTTTAATP